MDRGKQLQTVCTALMLIVTVYISGCICPLTLPAQPGKYFVSAKYSYIDVGIDVSLRTSIQFQVQGRSNGHIAFTKVQNDFTSNMYEVALGGIDTNNVMYSVIRKSCLGPNLAYSSTPKILNASEPRWFWASWSKATLILGYGYNVGVRPFINYTDPSPFPIRYVGVCGYTNAGNQTWTIPDSYRRQDDRLPIRRTHSNVYVNMNVVDVITMTSCTSRLLCAAYCTEYSLCTAFNLRPLANRTGCNCELQVSTPWPNSALVPQTGASHWELVY